MASDWIKMRVDIHDQPEVIGIARRNGLDVDAVVGKLVRIWGWANRVTADGHIPHVDRAYIDKVTHRRGFADAMAFVGWLSEDGESLIIPKFERHNSDGAKARALDTERKRSVRVETGQKSDKSRTKVGPEKRREDKNKDKEPPDPPKGGIVSPMPAVLDTPDFRKAWADFQQYSREKRFKRTPTADAALLKQLEEFGECEAMAKLTKAMANGWRGVIFSGDKPSHPSRFFSGIQAFAAEDQRDAN